jgi:WD40 repeat protein
MSATTEQGNATPDVAAWVADDPASSLRLALDMLDGNSARQAEPLLRWALGNLRSTVVLRGPTNWVTSASFSPDGQTVLIASQDHTVSVFKAADGVQLRRHPAHRA